MQHISAVSPAVQHLIPNDERPVEQQEAQSKLASKHDGSFAHDGFDVCDSSDAAGIGMLSNCVGSDCSSSGLDCDPNGWAG
jgi:ferredoxin